MKATTAKWRFWRCEALCSGALLCVSCGVSNGPSKTPPSGGEPPAASSETQVVQQVTPVTSQPAVSSLSTAVERGVSESHKSQAQVEEPSPVPVANIQSRKPSPVSPPFPASAREGDGEWLSYAEVEGPTSLWRTTLHPHRTSPFVSVTVVAIDLIAFGLDWVVGAADEGAEKLGSKMSVGLISTDAIAVFNGGFQARHGRWGQISHDFVLVEPKPEGCGVAITTDGRVELGSYAEVSPLGLLSYRQTPPCLVAGGSLNPMLLSGQDRLWAGKNEREKTRRRSALGLNRETSTLYYLVGIETDAIDLARALVALNVDVGLQLDINWNWTRFFLVGQNDGSPAVHSPLLEGMVMDAGEYVTRPSKRDFFMVRKRR